MMEALLELSGGKGGSNLVMPSNSIVYGKKYFVCNLENSKTAEVPAKTPDEACDLCGWWRKDCFVKMLVPEVTYAVR